MTTLHLRGSRNASAGYGRLASRSANGAAVQSTNDRVDEVAHGNGPREVEEGSAGLGQAAVLGGLEVVLLEGVLVATRASTGLGGNGSGSCEEEDPVEEVDNRHGEREGNGLNEGSSQTVEAAE